MSNPNQQELTRLVESRRTSVLRGVKQGAIKGAVDKAVDAISDPIIDKIIESFGAKAPAIETLRPAVGAVIKFIFMMGTAELCLLMGPIANKAMPASTEVDMAEKGVLLALWMREYAGEKLGKDIMDTALTVFPMVMAQFSDISVDDLKIVSNVSTEKVADRINVMADEPVKA